MFMTWATIRSGHAIASSGVFHQMYLREKFSSTFVSKGMDNSSSLTERAGRFSKRSDTIASNIFYRVFQATNQHTSYYFSIDYEHTACLAQLLANSRGTPTCVCLQPTQQTAAVIFLIASSNGGGRSSTSPARL